MNTSLTTRLAVLVLAAFALGGCDRRATDTAATPSTSTTTPAPMSPASAASQ